MQSKVILGLLAEGLKGFLREQEVLQGRINCHSSYRPSIKNVQEHSELNDCSEPLNNIRAKAGQPLVLNVKLAGKPVSMELDTGATVSLISEQAYESQLQECFLKCSEVKLRTYSGEALPVIGELDVTVSYDHQEAKLPLVVVKGAGPNLFGRNWLNVIRPNWESINAV